MTEKFSSLPIDQWPHADRTTWDHACRPSRRFNPGGAAGHMKQTTRTSMVRAYGYLLEHCQRTGTLDRKLEPAGHVTPDRINQFLCEILQRVCSVARYNYLQRIHRIARILNPTSDFFWLRDIVLEQKDKMRPRSKAARIVPTDRLYDCGLQLMKRARCSANRTDLQRARQYRNGLLVALLAVCPIRLKNLASLTVGQQLRKIGDAWWVMLSSLETKTGRPDERPLSKLLGSFIEEWLEIWRPLFLDPGKAMWASTKGGGLAYTYVGTIITDTTRRELGIAINPHLFRDCAVFTIAHEAGEQMGMASALLQHTDKRITQEHYNRGSSILAVKAFHEILDDIGD